MFDGQPPSAIRISHLCGHGDWHHPADRAMLEARVVQLNREFAEGKRWIQEQSK
ncbi:hypothetical protein [Parasedimentitalea psychrophila]|uniref:Uncharacterized protein n=1 Tax=Parasedimentitalea psychrophila TaxID=2997337 RepID=A0A9Y2KUH7_9RHOB|nr:hypothetical protein [Parasedimentitalea psychrophila]WIY23375.1 hypothetical protein QPJ95_11935 [Parasedimentitalea psychrophila]